MGCPAVAVWRCRKVAIAEVSHGDLLGANALSCSFVLFDAQRSRCNHLPDAGIIRPIAVRGRVRPPTGAYIIGVSREAPTELCGANAWTSTCTYSCRAARCVMPMIGSRFV